jgi:hypothetical protein
MSETNTEKSSNSVLKYIGIFGTIISVVAASIGLFKQLRSGYEAPDLSGVWIITHTVESANMDTYIGDRYIYKVSVNQKGNFISGAGEQKGYNDGPALKRFKISWNEMEVKDGDVVITYSLEANRPVSGNMTLKIDSDNTNHLSGTFYNPIADSKGRVEVVRE